MKEQYIAEIIAIECGMFNQSQSCDANRCCQMDRDMFLIIRTSQLETWNEKMLKTYLKDIQEAQKNGFNLLCEKRVHMMEQTDPQKYVQLKKNLPEPSVEKRWLVDLLCTAYESWQKDLADRHPEVENEYELAYGHLDKYNQLSLISFRGELMTYSVDMLRQYAANIEHIQQSDINMIELILRRMFAKCNHVAIKDLDIAHES